jgi:hypothetical protein
MPCLEPGPWDCSILQIESVRSLCINLFLGQLKGIVPVARRQNGRPGKQGGRMNQKLDMFLIGMLGDNFGSLDNDVQALLKPMHIGSQSDETLEIGVAQDTVSDTLADECSNAVLGDLLKRGISPFAELLKRAPSRPRNKGQGGSGRSSGREMLS